MAPMIVAHPAAHYPQMPWTGGDGGPALQPVFINPSDYQQMLQNQQNRPGSVDSESSSSKNSSRRGSMNQKFVPSVMQNKKMQLGKFMFYYFQLHPRFSRAFTRPALNQGPYFGYGHPWTISDPKPTTKIKKVKITFLFS